MPLAIALSAASAIAGMLISAWMRTDQGQLPLMLLGPAHAIAFIPLTAMISRSLRTTLIASVLCLTFYLWGMLGMGILLGYAPVACSAVWGMVIAWAWKRPIALLAIPIAGALAMGAMFLAEQRATATPGDDVLLPAAVGSWHLLMSICLPAIAMTSPFPPKPAEPLGTRCSSCGVVFDRLPEPETCSECGGGKVICPDCGHARSV